MRSSFGVAAAVAPFLLFLPPSATASPEGVESAALVVLADGAVERLAAGAESSLLEVGHEVALEDRVSVGNGSVLSLLPFAGEAAGRPARIRGPFDGTVRELLRAAVDKEPTGPAIPAEDLTALRRPSPAVLEGPGLTRGAARGPLRPVYPAGTVAAPCARFAFVQGLKDLSGGSLEVRIYEKDPAGGAEPVAKVKVKGSPADVEDATRSFAPRKTYWWKVVAVLDSGEEALSGEAAEFTVVPSPLPRGYPAGGLAKPEDRASWHMVRFRALRDKHLYLDALRELDSLAAAGGGSTVVDRSREQIARKLGTDAEDLDALADLASTGDIGTDKVKLVDGREMPGRLIREEEKAIVFQFDGVSYRIERSEIADLRRGSREEVVSAAPWITYASPRYAISTNAGKEFAQEAARNLEAAFDAFARTFGTELGARNARNLRVRIFRDAPDYAAYLRKDHPRQVDKAVGFYAFQDTTLYFHRSFRDGQEVTWPTLYHEATHQILHIVCNQDQDTTGLPGFWVLEALPCFMESLRWRGKDLEPGDPSPERTDNFSRLAKEGRLTPVRQFVDLSQALFLDADYYDQGNALFWFLLTADKGRHRPPLMKYMKMCLQNRSREDAVRKCFGREIEKVAEGYEDWFLERAAPR